MNRQQARGQLLHFAGVLREGWGRVINDHTMQIRGEQEQELGRLQMREGEPATTLTWPRRKRNKR